MSNSGNLMGNNEGSVEATLTQRGSVYGDYKDVVRSRSILLSVLKSHYKIVNGEPMTDEEETMFGDVVLKLVRAASKPSYGDSWLDLAGYATLIERTLDETVN